MPGGGGGVCEGGRVGLGGRMGEKGGKLFKAPASLHTCVLPSTCTCWILAMLDNNLTIDAHPIAMPARGEEEPGALMPMLPSHLNPLPPPPPKHTYDKTMYRHVQQLCHTLCPVAVPAGGDEEPGALIPMLPSHLSPLSPPPSHTIPHTVICKNYVNTHPVLLLCTQVVMRSLVRSS
jgi:hypothetical protein